MKKKAFTLAEILVVIVIIGIFGVLGLPYLQNAMENSKEEVCFTNQKAILKAVELYLIENGRTPASLSQVPQENYDKAFAQIMREKGAWKRKLAYFIVDLSERGCAFAQNPPMFLPRLHCPGNRAGGISYGLLGNFVNITAAQYKTYGNNIGVIVDSNTLVPGGVTSIDGMKYGEQYIAHMTNMQSLFSGSRHRQYNFLGSSIEEALAVGPGGTKIYVMP